MVVKASISELNKANAQAVANRGDVVIDALTKNVVIFTDPSPTVMALRARTICSKVPS